MCQRICPNSKKPSPIVDKILHKHYISLPICCQENAQTSLAFKQIHSCGEFEQSPKKEVFAQATIFSANSDFC